MEHGSIEWQLEQAERALADIRDIASEYKSKPYQKIRFLADHAITHNIIVRAAQQAGKASLDKVTS
jgi:hypothetical protein